MIEKVCGDLCLGEAPHGVTFVDEVSPSSVILGGTFKFEIQKYSLKEKEKTFIIFVFKSEINERVSVLSELSLEDAAADALESYREFFNFNSEESNVGYVFTGYYIGSLLALLCLQKLIPVADKANCLLAYTFEDPGCAKYDKSILGKKVTNYLGAPNDYNTRGEAHPHVGRLIRAIISHDADHYSQSHHAYMCLANLCIVLPMFAFLGYTTFWLTGGFIRQLREYMGYLSADMLEKQVSEVLLSGSRAYLASVLHDTKPADCVGDIMAQSNLFPAFYVTEEGARQFSEVAKAGVQAAISKLIDNPQLVLEQSLARFLLEEDALGVRMKYNTLGWISKTRLFWFFSVVGYNDTFSTLEALKASVITKYSTEALSAANLEDSFKSNMLKFSRKFYDDFLNSSRPFDLKEFALSGSSLFGGFIRNNAAKLIALVTSFTQVLPRLGALLGLSRAFPIIGRFTFWLKKSGHEKEMEIYRETEHSLRNIVSNMNNIQNLLSWPTESYEQSIERNLNHYSPFLWSYGPSYGVYQTIRRNEMISEHVENLLKTPVRY